MQWGGVQIYPKRGNPQEVVRPHPDDDIRCHPGYPIWDTPNLGIVPRARVRARAWPILVYISTVIYGFIPMQWGGVPIYPKRGNPQEVVRPHPDDDIRCHPGYPIWGTPNLGMFPRARVRARAWPILVYISTVIYGFIPMQWGGVQIYPKRGNPDEVI